MTKLLLKAESLTEFLHKLGCSIYINNNIKLYTNIKNVDLNLYKKSDRFSSKAKYRYEEILIDTNENKRINYVFGFFCENTVEINGEFNLKNINDTVRILGENLKESKLVRQNKLWI
ncbi:hypothetical protein [Niallia taxi]|uniref:Uncharacterized protein n=1 Tax=Niallia taxi TaxID=2499688 RepID=A0A3S2X8V0_9BACI|nr:hypothetical protein [Niallia taxi]RVT62697.1 hypothetical protein EM808_13105 [Niallia taxi]